MSIIADQSRNIATDHAMEGSTRHKDGGGKHGHGQRDDDGGCDNVCTEDVVCASSMCGILQRRAGWGNEGHTIYGMRRAGM